ncbi:uncharacterized protein DUF998 [Kribbella sp. VKM Ac-2527]|uniref:Uncharacterized protein DUF998 n=1 Tax=Kribbella caucasensis TaxID=2512215 RepID=A0A4R6JBV0_9ACTN|nr:DUF998 domain-containing protein [Kribbella sp. VKM Ac-2527]TDO33240.1 uncharacterized protein DUF998 [Kribbella sp. VKM Ac-2527]
MTTTTYSTTAVATNRLISCGMAAGPFYVAVVVAQVFARDGFDPTKHAASLLTLGDYGWIQIANFVITGVLLILGAIGLHQTGAFGSRWAPRLLGLYGVSMIAAGALVPDPALGFPVGTPDGQPVTMSWHGVGHFAAGGVGFLGFIICCFVLARRFAAGGERGWSAYSIGTGVVFLAAFAGIGSGSAGAGVTVAFWIAVVLAFGWITAVLRQADRRTGD